MFVESFRMNPLHRAIIEKAGHNHGFEHLIQCPVDEVRMASSLHPVQVEVQIVQDRFRATFNGTNHLVTELQRQFPDWFQPTSSFQVKGEAELATLLNRASALARALPNQPVADFESEVSKALTDLATTPSHTEVERMVRQRVGQEKFRNALLTYWGGACAVTGVSLPEVLRASHIKPWSECESDMERLDVFNGFLLTANLDALFDKFLITFDRDGALQPSPNLSAQTLTSLGITPDLRLRWCSMEHQVYLEQHRKRTLQLESN